MKVSSLLLLALTTWTAVYATKPSGTTQRREPEIQQGPMFGYTTARGGGTMPGNAKNNKARAANHRLAAVMMMGMS